MWYLTIFTPIHGGLISLYIRAGAMSACCMVFLVIGLAAITTTTAYLLGIRPLQGPP
jgi:hypothetical protein